MLIGIWRCAVYVAVVVTAIVLVRPSFAASEEWILDARSTVRSELSVMSDGSSIVAVFRRHADGNLLSVIDLHTRREWQGDQRELSTRYRFLEAFDAASEPSNSYLAQLGCRSFDVCTGLESHDFTVFWRRGDKPGTVVIKFMNFSNLFEEVARALSGEEVVDVSALALASSANRIALNEVGSGSWRSRFIAAIRASDSADRLLRIEQSGILQTLNGFPFFTRERQLWSLRREAESARCRGDMEQALNQTTHQSDLGMKAVRSVLARCSERFVQLVATTLDIPPTMHALIAAAFNNAMRRNGPQADDADLGQLVHFFFTAYPTLRDATHPPRPSAPASGTKEPRPPFSSRPLQPSPAAPSSPVITAQRAAENIRVSTGSAVDEWLRIRVLPQKLNLLSFSETSGRTKSDAADVSGTVFIASSIGELSEGRFRIETFNKAGAPIRFAYGAYGVRARATLDWTRVDQCEGLITRLLCSSEPVSASDRREVDFQLAPVNGFRDFVQVIF